MPTSYTDTAAVYDAHLSDGVTSDSLSFRIDIRGLPASVIDAAANAFFTVISENYLPVVSSQKIIEATGDDGWEWVDPNP